MFPPFAMSISIYEVCEAQVQNESFEVMLH